MSVAGGLDVIVFGEGLAGHAAAFALQSRGLRVAMTGRDRDGIFLEDRATLHVPRYGPSPLPSSAITHALHAERMARGIGALPLPCPTLAFDHDECAVASCDDGSVRARALVFASAGSLPVPAPHWDPHWGRGLSNNGWSDAIYYRGRRIAVVGSGPRLAVELAWLRAVAAELWALVRGSAHSAATLGLPSDHVLTEVTDVAPIEDAGSGSLVGVRYASDAQVRSLPVDGVFLADEPVPSWGVFGGGVRPSVRSLFVAGVAAGVAWEDDIAQWASGERAGYACAEALAQRPADAL